MPALATLTAGPVPLPGSERPRFPPPRTSRRKTPGLPPPPAPRALQSPAPPSSFLFFFSQTRPSPSVPRRVSPFARPAARIFPAFRRRRQASGWVLPLWLLRFPRMLRFNCILK